MLRQEQVTEIKALLAAKILKTEIARRTGVCRASVTAIAQGKYDNRVYAPVSEPRKAPKKLPRCPTCGSRQTQPCVVCRERARAKLWRVVLGPPDFTEADDLFLGVNLKGAHLRRYRTVWAAKVAQEGHTLCATDLRRLPRYAGDENNCA